MIPSFNTAGPCIPGEHYMIPPERRLSGMRRLIDEGKYFTLHAGRQTGKTTSAMWLVDELNRQGRYSAAWLDVQRAREEPDPGQAFQLVLGAFDNGFARDLPRLARPGRTAIKRLLEVPGSAIVEYLSFVARRSSRPLVLFIDEADGLVGKAMLSFLTQLREGYIARSKKPFPHSIALVGQRQVRDYVLEQKERQGLRWLGTTSPFNITAEALTLASFTRDEVAELVGQHTAKTGQRFEPAAVESIYDLSRGHPWLVNAMADQVVNRAVEDRSVSVTPADVESAKETLILQRRTHIDSIVARLREERVRRVVEPMLTGGSFARDVLDDDLSYVAGLGLIALREGKWVIANRIYAEVVPRALTFVQQTSLDQNPAWYVRSDGRLDIVKLMTAFQEFWRKDGHLAAEGFAYREAGPHLLLRAFLQRVVNGGGRIEREYGLGRGALDLMVFFKDERFAIEVKLRRGRETEKDALKQVSGYLERAGLKEGWLVLFDLRKRALWKKKLLRRHRKVRGKRVHVIGL
ncbi:MAG: AAA-like domain-containing protein [Deltaproteobacteria bacterium]|nr:AAA-like domain-containing protein [Deltaproteobacteria bacterium]